MKERWINIYTDQLGIIIGTSDYCFDTRSGARRCRDKSKKYYETVMLLPFADYRLIDNLLKRLITIQILLGGMRPRSDRIKAIKRQTLRILREEERRLRKEFMGEKSV